MKKNGFKHLTMALICASVMFLSACRNSNAAWNNWINGNLDVQTQKTITQNIGKFLKSNYDGKVKYNDKLEMEYEGDFCGILPDSSLSGKENRERLKSTILDEIDVDSISEYCVVFLDLGDGEYSISVVVNP